MLWISFGTTISTINLSDGVYFFFGVENVIKSLPSLCRLTTHRQRVVTCIVRGLLSFIDWLVT